MVASPLSSNLLSEPYELSNGISIRNELPIQWDDAIVNDVIPQFEREDLRNTNLWLCVSDHEEQPVGYDFRALYTKARHALWALQILCPNGAMNLYLELEESSGGFRNSGTSAQKALCKTRIGNVSRINETSFERDFDAVYEMVSRAYTEKVVRLQNPIVILEHGMQIGEPMLGTLLFTMGLDMLVMAGDCRNFVARLGGFLGPTNRVFPENYILERQAKLCVEEILPDIYGMRNIVAHGQQVPLDPYRTPYALKDVNGNPMDFDESLFGDIVLQATLFLLTSALRKVALDGLFDEVADEATWKQKMSLFERRWSDLASDDIRRRLRKDGCSPRPIVNGVAPQQGNGDYRIM